MDDHPGFWEELLELVKEYWSEFVSFVVGLFI